MPTIPHDPKASPGHRPDTRPAPTTERQAHNPGAPVPEKRPPVTQKIHPALALIESSPDVFSRQGSVVATWRSYAGRKLGPYFRLVYRRDGRQLSVYLGRAGQLVDRVRAALAKLKQPLRRHRTLVRLQKQVRASLRLEKARLNQILGKWGLHLKGFELRGPRNTLQYALANPLHPKPPPTRPAVK